MADRILIPLAPGFEEIEAVTLIDVLRRAELPVQVVHLGGGEPRVVTGSHGIGVQTDAGLADVDAETVRCVVLPGGMPGAENLRDDAGLQAFLRQVHGAGGEVGAICAAPIALAAAGLLEDREATCYPGFEERLGDARVVRDRAVVRSGRIWTSRGPGTAFELALALVGELAGEERAQALREGMLVGAGA